MRQCHPDCILTLLFASDVCISCDNPKETVVAQHPVFRGGLCQDCKVSKPFSFEPHIDVMSFIMN